MPRRFKPNFWTRQTEHDKKCGVKRHEMPRSIRRKFQKPQDGKDHINSAVSDETKGSHHKHHSEHCLPELERQYSDTITVTDVEEVWFAGSHTGTNLEMDEAHN